MMFEHTSRYYSLPVATVEAGGRTVSYVRRRFLPSSADLPLLAEVPVEQGERVDMLAHRTLGDPLAWWRVCDANDTLDPRELTEGSGRLVRIPVPQAEG